MRVSKSSFSSFTPASWVIVAAGVLSPPEGKVGAESDGKCEDALSDGKSKAAASCSKAEEAVGGQSDPGAADSSDLDFKTFIKYNVDADPYKSEAEEQLRAGGEAALQAYVFDKFDEATWVEENYKPVVWLIEKGSEDNILLAIDAANYRCTPVEPKELKKIAFAFKFTQDKIQASLPTTFWSGPVKGVHYVGKSTMSLATLKRLLTRQGAFRSFKNADEALAVYAKVLNDTKICTEFKRTLKDLKFSDGMCATRYIGVKALQNSGRAGVLAARGELGAKAAKVGIKVAAGIVALPVLLAIAHSSLSRF